MPMRPVPPPPMRSKSDTWEQRRAKDIMHKNIELDSRLKRAHAAVAFWFVIACGLFALWFFTLFLADCS